MRAHVDQLGPGYAGWTALNAPLVHLLPAAKPSRLRPHRALCGAVFVLVGWWEDMSDGLDSRFSDHPDGRPADCCEVCLLELKAGPGAGYNDHAA